MQFASEFWTFGKPVVWNQTRCWRATHPSYLIAGISSNAGELRLTSISMGESITVGQTRVSVDK